MRGNRSVSEKRGTFLLFWQSGSRKVETSPFFRPCFFLLAIFLLSATGCDTAPCANRHIQEPGFWISRNDSADKIILSQSGIAAFNSRTEKELGLIKDLLKTGPVCSGEELASSLRKEFAGFVKQKLYAKDSIIAAEPFYQEMEKQISVAAIPSRINARYGFIRHYADQRLLPTEDILTVLPADAAFDELQNSSLDIGTPLVALHESRDGLWVYVYSPTSSGWVKKDKVAFCEFSDFKAFLGRSPFAVVVSAKAGIFQDPALTRRIGYVRMGAKFPLIGIASETATVLIPSQQKEGKFVEQAAYLRKAEINPGYLEYTPRNTIEQAFKLLGAPYGWGGKGGEQDCSGFIQEVFSTVGIVLPRDSAEQGRSGKLLGNFEQKTSNELKTRILAKEAIGGVTILQLKGHILLYLGMFGNRPYVIHEIYGYRQKQGLGKEVFHKLNRAVVSDLALGEGSRKGSLLERVISIRSIAE
ncbi:MAG: SH3 domain-containing protein [Candidatus Omnitrophota bacterium]